MYETFYDNYKVFDLLSLLLYQSICKSYLYQQFKTMLILMKGESQMENNCKVDLVIEEIHDEINVMAGASFSGSCSTSTSCGSTSTSTTC